MNRYLQRIFSIPISKIRNKERRKLAYDSEIRDYRSLAGTLIYLGSGILPEAAYVTSTMQQKLPRLTIQDLLDANAMVKELLTLPPYITYPRPFGVHDVIISTFSDAWHRYESCYAQAGVISGLKIVLRDSPDIFYLIDWSNQKQRRVSYSAYGAEILAASQADDSGYYFKVGMRSLLPNSNMQHDVPVDSRGIFDTITALHDGREYRLRHTIQRLGDRFESGELDRLRWIPGKQKCSRYID